jgi:DNA-binding Lrp family transcriptional regulator
MQVVDALFHSRTRTAVLTLLFVEKRRGSIAELARRARLSPRTVRAEIENLEAVGLVRREAVGPADLVSANFAHPKTAHVVALLGPDPDPLAAEEHALVRESLAAYGAPLLGITPVPRMSPEDAIVAGLLMSRQDPALLRTLPLVVAGNAQRLDWARLHEEARRRKQKAELGMLLDLTARLTGRPELSERARSLRDRRRGLRSFFPLRGRYHKRVTEMNTPAVARRWGFLLNMPEDSFRTLFEKHRENVQR